MIHKESVHFMQEIETLKEDTAVLKEELVVLQRANARLASMLYGQKEALEALRERITASAARAETVPNVRELKKAA